MNYCTRCGSLYQNAGTCNCYATQQPITPTPAIYPIYPVYPVNPWPPYTVPAWPPTITWGDTGDGLT